MCFYRIFNCPWSPEAVSRPVVYGRKTAVSNILDASFSVAVYALSIVSSDNKHDGLVAKISGYIYAP